MSPQLNKILDIEYPIIMAPMFLVSDVNMVISALNSGITAAIPALNYRTILELRTAIQTIKKTSDKAFGINLIANQSNILLHKQLEVCCEEKIAFVITSLGKPEQIINKCKPLGIKVFCDVTDVFYAKKVELLGADAIIAVGSEAGGHSGLLDSEFLIKELQKEIQIPIISAGGIGNRSQYLKRIQMGIAGVSIGSIFIASTESPVNDLYKNACIQYGEKDIVMTDKLSGTPCTVINTPFVQKWNKKSSLFVQFWKKNKRFKKIAKIILFKIGLKKLYQSAFNNSLEQVWCAGKSIEEVREIKSIKEIVNSLVRE
ncbi:MAG: nitronate monooxygenase [Flavobacteriia bacterium]|nr:nitronate monooxygenase [Flavobacteriia bacterium]